MSSFAPANDVSVPSCLPGPVAGREQAVFSNGWGVVWVCRLHARRAGAQFA